MPRDLLYIPQEGSTLVLATDCSSSIGMKERDKVKASYEFTTEYLSRVVLMELISVGAEPLGYTLTSSFPYHWNDLRKGIENSFKQVGLANPPHIGSSEKNFPAEETSVGITVLGRLSHSPEIPDYLHYAVIGRPLVGQELLDEEASAVSLKECLDLRHSDCIGEMLPVGSRGIRAEFEDHFGKKLAPCNLDIDKSAGPSSCLIVSYSPKSKSLLIEQYKERISFLELED